MIPPSLSGSPGRRGPGDSPPATSTWYVGSTLALGLAVNLAVLWVLFGCPWLLW